MALLSAALTASTFPVVAIPETLTSLTAMLLEKLQAKIDLEVSLIEGGKTREVLLQTTKKMLSKER